MLSVTRWLTGHKKMAKKKPLFGVNNYKKRTPKKRPGRHAKKYSKRKPRRKRSRGQGRWK